MIRAVAIATLLSIVPLPPAVQDGRSVLRVKVVVVDSAGMPRPVPRHVLLVSDNPATAAPRRLQTANDGTATVRLPRGNYTVESERPVTIGAKTYEWLQIIDILPSRDVNLELTAANAEVADTASTALTADASSLLIRWQDSVFALWSPTAPASGVLIDPRGLIVSNQKAIGRASVVEVQLSATTKVAARVLVVDRVRDVAVLWIDPKLSASVTPVSLGCADSKTLAIIDGQEIHAVGAPLRRDKAVAAGRVNAIEGRVVVADMTLAAGVAGGPIFSTAGHLVGISSLLNEEDGQPGEARVVRLEEVCAVVALAEQQMKYGRAPEGRLLPVEPQRPFPLDALKDVAKPNAVSPASYRVSSPDYDLTFITPVLMHAADEQQPQSIAAVGVPDPRAINSLADFSNWSAYVADGPPVVMVRATPKLVEGFWTKVARGAARTQGVALPPIKHFKPGFGRMQAFCGNTEVTPIHAFKLEQRVSESEAVYEGLYVFDPDALGPACGTVKLALYSEKEPDKGDVRTVDPKVVQQVWEDFAVYRTAR